MTAHVSQPATGALLALPTMPCPVCHGFGLHHGPVRRACLSCDGARFTVVSCPSPAELVALVGPSAIVGVEVTYDEIDWKVTRCDGVDASLCAWVDCGRQGERAIAVRAPLVELVWTPEGSSAARQSLVYAIADALDAEGK